MIMTMTMMLMIMMKIVIRMVMIMTFLMVIITLPCFEFQLVMTGHKLRWKTFTRYDKYAHIG